MACVMIKKNGEKILFILIFFFIKSTNNYIISNLANLMTGVSLNLVYFQTVLQCSLTEKIKIKLRNNFE